MAGNILEKIAATKRMEVEAMKRLIPAEALREHAGNVARTALSMRDSILGQETAVIAEHKRRSPSKGEIFPMSEAGEIASSYAANGAAAMSVLTDTPYFGGSTADLAVARMSAPALPLLRKEFIVDEYQLYQARIYGADAVLLIVAMTGDEDTRRLNDVAHEIGLQTLVEIHTPEEAAFVPADADMAGINNRDLASFSTDISNSARLIDRLPSGIVKIAESGIRTPDDVRRLKSVGFDGFLIGEAFMSSSDPGATLREFIEYNRER